MATIIEFPSIVQRDGLQYDDFRDHGLSHESSIIAEAYSIEIDSLREQLATANAVIKRMKRNLQDRHN